MADKQFLGNRINELEDKTGLATTTNAGIVTLADTITSGDTTHVPTTGAVYSAMSSGGLGSWLLPKPREEATNNDDFFISTNTANVGNPTIANYTIHGNLINVLSYVPSGSTQKIIYLWFKCSAFNLDTDPLSLLSKITFISTGYGYNASFTYNIYPNITLILNSDEYNVKNGYLLATLEMNNVTADSMIGNKFKLIYTP